MTSLRLTIDATGMRRGADDAKRALDDVKRSAQDADVALDAVSTQGFQSFSTGAQSAAERAANLRNQIQLVGNSVQAAGGIRQTVDAVRDLGTGFGNVSNIALGSSRALLDFAQVSREIQQLRIAAGVSETASAWSVLNATMKASPLLAVSLALSAISVAMSLFSRNTREATSAFDQLLARADDTRRLNQLRLASGGTARLPTADDTREAIRAIQGSVGPAGAVSAERTARGFGITDAELRDVADRLGVTIQRAFVRGGERGAIPGGRTGEFQVAASDIERIGLFIASWRQAIENIPTPPAPGSRAGEVAGRVPYGPGRDEADIQLARFAQFDTQKRQYLESIAQETELARMHVDVREQEQAVLQLVNAAKREGMEVNEAEIQFIKEQIALQQQLNDLYRFGAQFGGALATNVWDAFIQRGNVARNLVAGLLQDLANIARGTFAQGLSNAFGSLFTGFGSTARQNGPPDLGLGTGTTGGYGRSE